MSLDAHNTKGVENWQRSAWSIYYRALLRGGRSSNTRNKFGQIKQTGASKQAQKQEDRQDQSIFFKRG